MEQPTRIAIDCLYDPDLSVGQYPAGPHGVTVYPIGEPDSPWRFTLFGFPDVTEALKAANAEIVRRRRADTTQA